MLFHKVDHGTDPCYGFLKLTNTKHASGKRINFQDLVTDPNLLFWKRRLSQGKIFALGFVLLQYPLLVLAWLFRSALPFCFTEWFSKARAQARNKSAQMLSIGGSVGPSIILPPTAQTSIQTIYSLTV